MCRDSTAVVGEEGGRNGPLRQLPALPHSGRLHRQKPAAGSWKLEVEELEEDRETGDTKIFDRYNNNLYIFITSILA